MQLLKINDSMTHKEKRSVRRKNQTIREMIADWESWEHLIIEEPKDIDFKIQCYVKATNAFGVGRDNAEKYALERLKKLNLIQESVK